MFLSFFQYIQSTVLLFSISVISLSVMMSTLWGAHSVEAKRPRSLIGGKASLSRQNTFARSEKLKKLKNGKEVRSAVKKGKLKRVSATRYLELAYVSFPFAHPKLKSFLHRLSKVYYKVCRTPLVITSLVRPRNKQPRNASPHSVHPTGIAVDLRVPPPQCREWLNHFLVQAERRRYLEATRELRPPHYHVVIHPQKINRVFDDQALYSLRKKKKRSTQRVKKAVYTQRKRTKRSVARTQKRTTRQYRVRSGDSLWMLAQRWKTSVKKIKRHNALKSNRIDAGQTLYIP